MRITLDLSPVVHRKAGLATYAQNLAEHLLACDSENSYAAFHYGQHVVAPLKPPLAGLPRRVVPWGARRWRMTVAAQYFFGATMDRTFAGAELFHATEHLLPPLRNMRTVFTFHDAIYALFPQYHLPMNRWFLGLMMPRFLKRADCIIAVSESSRRDAIRLYHADPSRICVIYEGANPAFRPIEDAARLAQVREKYQLPSRFMLYVGTIEPRKNLGMLLEAYRVLRARDETTPRLVIAGRKGWLYQPVFDRLHELGLEEQVSFPDWIESEDLPALVNAAQVFVFPSLYEGFGLPPLEAMSCGTPVVCSNASSLPEVVGDAGLLVDPREVGAWVHALARVFADAPLRADLHARGLAQAHKFSWERAARETLAVYAQVRGGKIKNGSA